MTEVDVSMPESGSELVTLQSCEMAATGIVTSVNSNLGIEGAISDHKDQHKEDNVIISSVR